MSTPIAVPPNQYYTKVNNTVVDALAVSNALTPDQWKNLVLSSFLGGTMTPVAPTTANVALGSINLASGLITQIFVDGSGLTAARALTIGADTAVNAATLLAYFGLLAVGDCVRLRFATSVTSAAYAIALANTSGTSTYVKITTNAGVSASTQELFASGALANVTQDVTIKAVNVTAGSEAISFIVKA